jgi:hypothetical protein
MKGQQSGQFLMYRGCGNGTDLEGLCCIWAARSTAQQRLRAAAAGLKAWW